MKDTADGIAELKDYFYALVDPKEAYKFEETTKRIGNYVGRVYNHHMRALVVSGVELALTKPVYPTGKDPSEEKKAVWSKDYDTYIRKKDLYEEHKSKVFIVIMGRCTKAMRNRIEKLDAFKDSEKTNDVVALLKLIKRQIFDVNDRKHPSLRSVLALKKLCSCRQHDKEDLIDYYRRFNGVVEMVELSYGELSPDNKDSRNKLVAMIFMEGVD